MAEETKLHEFIPVGYEKCPVEDCTHLVMMGVAQKVTHKASANGWHLIIDMNSGFVVAQPSIKEAHLIGTPVKKIELPTVTGVYWVPSGGYRYIRKDGNSENTRLEDEVLDYLAEQNVTKVEITYKGVIE